jgi:hypothetical protein
MDDEAEHLEQADRHIAQAEKHVQSQELLIERLKTQGHPVNDAVEFLATLTDTLRAMEYHRRLLRSRMGR